MALCSMNMYRIWYFIAYLKEKETKKGRINSKYISIYTSILCEDYNMLMISKEDKISLKNRVFCSFQLVQHKFDGIACPDIC
jgi:hypothetical protein